MTVTIGRRELRYCISLFAVLSFCRRHYRRKRPRSAMITRPAIATPAGVEPTIAAAKPNTANGFLICTPNSRRCT